MSECTVKPLYSGLCKLVDKEELERMGFCPDCQRGVDPNASKALKTLAEGLLPYLNQPVFVFTRTRGEITKQGAVI